MMETTLAIIKPDAVAAGHAGEIISRIEREGIKILAMKMKRLTAGEAKGFYNVHKDKPFFDPLVKFMTSGNVVLMTLEGDNMIKRWRELMGPTDSKKAPKGTIRGDFGTDIEKNACHGSDAPDTAKFEVGYFFPELK